MGKKKVNYKKIYDDYFGIIRGADIRIDEYEYIISNGENIVPAPEVHHIEHGANKIEHINNYMALSVENHKKAHKELLKRAYLKEIHLQFMGNNPY